MAGPRQDIARVAVLEGRAPWPSERVARYRASVSGALPAGAQVEVTSVSFALDHHQQAATRLTSGGAVDVFVADYLQAAEVVSRVARARGLVVHAHVLDPVARAPELRLADRIPACFITSRIAMEAKLVELSIDALPGLRRVGYVYDPEFQSLAHSTLEASRALGLTLIPVPAPADTSIETVTSTLVKRQVGAAIVMVTNGLWPRRVELFRALIAAGLPSVSERPAGARAGALIGYGPDPERHYEQSAGYVARLLRGENARHLPILTPDRLLLEVNVTTGRRLGVRLSTGLLRRATALLQ